MGGQAKFLRRKYLSKVKKATKPEVFWVEWENSDSKSLWIRPATGRNHLSSPHPPHSRCWLGEGPSVQSGLAVDKETAKGHDSPRAGQRAAA